MNEEEIQQVGMQLESHREQMEGLRQQEELIRNLNNEYMRARDTLLNMMKRSPDEEMLVPIGGNYFIFARVDKPEKAIGSVGMNIAAEESTEKAVERLDKRIAELSDAGTKLAQSMQELDGKIMALTDQLQKEYAKQME
ncbi:MAG: prefoldin subunit alpha [Thermoplasmata archaeon]|nr:prefoldin subunit alpha [Thermoplasmata archaeon]